MSILFQNLTKQQWENEVRQSKLRLFEQTQYGVRPDECNKPLTYKVLDEKKYDKFTYTKVGMYYNDFEMIFYTAVPNDNLRHRTFVDILHPFAEKDKDIWADYKQISNFYNPDISNYAPIDELIDNGFALAMLSANTVAEDHYGAEFTGIFGAMGCERTATSWGVLSAWAWACSKILDYLITQPYCDSEHVAVIGHSRGGKTALLASAYDTRFAMAVSNCSGNSGAALSLGSQGESVELLIQVDPFWYCENYKNYVNNEGKLPVDQNMLIALQAPRTCCVGSASEDVGADPDGELLSCKLASNVYQLYGKEGVIVPDNIQLDVSYDQGSIAYHRRKGPHRIWLADWQRYMKVLNNIK